MKNPYQGAVDQYKSIELQTRIESANPHELINLLLQGVRSNIACAQGNIQRKQISEKGAHISKAISILDGLRTCLDHEKGGEMSTNLDNLYEYVQNILYQANLKNDAELLVQANTLIAEIHPAWQEMPWQSA